MKCISKILCFFIPLIVAVGGCTAPLILKNMPYNEPGYYMFGKIPQRIFYEDVKIGQFKEIWNNETNGSQSSSSAIIYYKTLFVYDLSGRIYAFDKENGKLSGYEKYYGAISVAPVVNNLRVFFVVTDRLERFSTFYVFDFINGKVLHEEKVAGGITNEMLRLDDGIVLLTDMGELIKFNLVGTKLWSLKTKTTALSSPASDNKVIITGNEKGELISVKSENGEIESTSKFPRAITSGITIDKNNIYFADNAGVLYSVDFKSKKINWTFDSGAKIVSTPVFDAQKIYVGNLVGKIFAVEKSSGKQVWVLDSEGLINTTPLITKNVLVQPDYNKRVLFIGSADGKLESSISYDRRSKMTPILYDNILYMGSDRGLVHAYQLEMVK